MQEEITHEVIQKELEEGRRNSPYIVLVEGADFIQVTIDKVIKNTEAMYKLTKVDYAYELHLKEPEGKIISVNAWKFWKELRRAFDEAGRTSDVTLKIRRPKRGEYEVVLVEGNEENNTSE